MLNYIWLVLSLVWVTMIVLVLYRRFSAGAILLDLGPQPKRYLMFAAATMLLGVTIFQLFQTSEIRVYQQIAFVVWAAYMTVAGMGRLQLREGGISTGPDVVPWNRILSFDADGLRFSRMMGETTMKVPLTPSQAEQVQQIIVARKASGEHDFKPRP